MRILHLGKYFPPVAGGIENFLCDLISAQNRAGIDASAIVHSHPSDKINTGFKTSFNVWRVPCCGSLIYAPVCPGFPFALNRAISIFKPDILHLHMPNTSAFWVMADSSARKIPWVVHWHSDVAPSSIDRRINFAYKFYRPFEQRLLKNCSLILTTSPFYQKYSRALSPWIDKCRPVPLGLNPCRLKKSASHTKNRAKRIWGNKSFRVLAIGRLTYYKGHDILIKATAVLPGIKVIIAGEGGLRIKLEKIINTLGLQNKVRLTGHLKEDDLCALLETCDCLCLPSLERTEAFGLVILEAMRFAKPVVASNINGSGIGWAVRHKETGLLVNPGDIGELADALRLLSNSPETLKNMAGSAVNRFNNVFHIDRITEKTAVYYREVLGGCYYPCLE
ncbi:MAG TPA: glycosyltransferase [Desulfobacteraceae bacterium]|nr:glycosyltransferase [Desulfobacteraceae bacterium]